MIRDELFATNHMGVRGLMMLRVYDNLFLPANDLDRAREFYTGVLGLPVKFDFSSRGLLSFRVGDEEPALILGSQRTKLIEALKSGPVQIQ